MQFTDDVLDCFDSKEMHVCGVASIHRISENVLEVEFFARKMIDGRLRRVTVLRCLWDRDNWLAVSKSVLGSLREIAAEVVEPVCDGVPPH